MMARYYLLIRGFIEKKHLLFVFFLCFLFFWIGLNPFLTDRYAAIILLLIALFVKIFTNPSILKKNFLLTVAFGFSLALFTFIFTEHNFSLTSKMFIVPISYFLIGDLYNKKENFFFISFYVLGAFLSAFLNLAYTLANTGFAFNSIQRININAFTHLYNTATLFSVSAFVVFSYSVVQLVYFKKNKWYIISLSISGVLISVIGSIFMQNRSFILCSLILILLMCFIKMKKRWIVLVFIFTILLIFLLLRTNAFGIGSFLSKAPFINRIISGGSNSARAQIYLDFLNYFWKHPFGGLTNDPNMSNKFIHNVVLDIYSLGGIVPFVLIFFILVPLFTNSILILKGRYSLVDISTVFVFFGAFLLFMFEPIIQANYYMFSLLFLFYPVLEKSLSDCSIEKNCYIEITI